jgi:outer membrane protein TolC
MKYKKNIALCLIAMFSATSVFAYSDTALQGMLARNNTDLNKAREEVELASLDVKDAEASFHPSIDYTAGAMYLVNPPSISYDLDKTSLMSAVTAIETENYGKVEFSSINEYLASIPDTLTGTLGNMVYQADVALTQPLFTWGKLNDAVSIYNKVELVRNLQVTSLTRQLGFELRGREAAVYYLKQMRDNLKMQNEIATKLVSISQDAKDNGMLVAQDVLDAKVKAKKVDVGIKQLTLELNKQLVAIRTLTGNQDIDVDDIEFVPDEDAMVELINSDWDSILKKALEPTRETFAMLNLLENVSSEAKDVADNSIYWKPDVALKADLYYTGYYTSIQSGDYNYKDSYGLNLTIGLGGNLWDGGKRLNEISRKTIEEESAALDTIDAKEQVAQKINESLLQINYSTSNIEFKELSAEVAKSKVDQNMAIKDVGYGDETDVLMSQLDQYGFLLEALQEKVTRATSYYTVEYLIGK